MKQAVIRWEGNIPVTESRDVFPVAELKNVTEAILAEPFEDPLGIWPEYIGLSKGEVVLRQLIGRATCGDKDATKELLDRLVGRPKQQIESKKLSMTYQEYLDGIDRETVNVSSTPTK